MHARVCMSVCVSVRAHTRVCTRVPLSEQRGKECGRGVRACVRACARVCVYNKRMYLEIQLNYISVISLTRERSVLQLRVIFVMVSVLFKTTEEGLVSKGC